MSEASLQKLKVTELKELLSKHDLPQTGKKDDLVKRLVEAGIAPEVEVAGGEQEELVGPDVLEPPADEAPSTEAAPTTTEQSTSTEAPAQELTPEQQAMKSRAERFGIAFNPNPTSSSSSRNKAPASSSTSANVPATAAGVPAATPAPKKEKAGAIDKAPLGISEEVLAKRAAKFGLPEKREEKATATKTEPKAKEEKVEPKKAEVEMTPEMKEKLAVEEEKKRKRAEKFGTAKPANGTDTEESDAKKLKV